MSKKRLNTILLLSAALIWGLALYKFISPYFAKTQTLELPLYPVQKRGSPMYKMDTIALVFPTRDPFLGKTTQTTKKRPAIPSKVKIPVKTGNTTQVEWPTIEYLGFVKSKKSNNPLGLVRIDGKLHRVHLNTVINGLRISQIDSDIIKLSNGSSSRTFKKR